MKLFELKEKTKKRADGKVFFRSLSTYKVCRQFVNAPDGATMVVYDTETTDRYPEQDTTRIVQLAAIRYQKNGNEWEQIDELNELLNPEMSIPEAVSAINHIYDDDVADKETFADRKDRIFSVMDADFWVGHNILGFDNVIMKRYYEKLDKELPVGFSNSIDTLDMAVDTVDHKECKNYNLTSMSNYFGIEESTVGTNGFHDALFDIRQDAKLFFILLSLYDLQGEEFKFQDGYVNQEIVPLILSVKYWEAEKGAWTHGRYYFVKTSCGEFKYDLYNQVWDGMPTKAVSLDAVIQAVYQFCGVRSDTGLLFWNKD